MAAIEVETEVRLVLDEQQLERMYKAVRGREHFWVRLCIESEAAEEERRKVIAYLQGPDGEEEVIPLGIKIDME